MILPRPWIGQSAVRRRRLRVGGGRERAGPQDNHTNDSGDCRGGEYPELGLVGEVGIGEGEAGYEDGDGEADPTKLPAAQWGREDQGSPTHFHHHADATKRSAAWLSQPPAEGERANASSTKPQAIADYIEDTQIRAGDGCCDAKRPNAGQGEQRAQVAT